MCVILLFQDVTSIQCLPCQLAAASRSEPSDGMGASPHLCDASAILSMSTPESKCWISDTDIQFVVLGASFTSLLAHGSSCYTLQGSYWVLIEIHVICRNCNSFINPCLYVQSHSYIRRGNRRLSLSALPGLPAASRGVKLPLLANARSVF